jgi:6,7-dimethyl-8-ribityllumazine synthase|tara:strand:- start:497 stop:898 length:402 start_codon:yes stop_codon:yes gene_type:complete
MIAVITSEFNKEIVNGLLDGCKKSLKGHDLDIIKVPGAFELPSTAQQCVDSNKYLAVITLGCVIKGETDHYDYICQAVSIGVMNVSIESNIPVLFGVLTCQNSQLAFERSRDNDFNKGFEVGNAAKKLLKLDL